VIATADTVRTITAATKSDKMRFFIIFPPKNTIFGIL
jgi:hypothetical protein